MQGATVRASTDVEAPRLGRIVGVFAAIAVLFLLLVAALNVYFDPLNFNPAAQGRVAQELVAGRNYAVYDPNLDFRALRRESIARLTRTPDVVIFAGSRFQEARPSYFQGTGYTFYNAFVHNDYFEDLVAVTQLLDAHGRLPKTLVLSVRFNSFNTPRSRETEEYKNFAGEYAALAPRIGAPALGPLDRLPLRFWSNVFSLQLLARNAQRAFAPRPLGPGPTDQDSLPALDVLRADGSLGFSRKHGDSWSTASSRADALTRGNQARGWGWSADPARIDAFGRLLDYLQARNVHVVVAIMPHHPLFWQTIAGSQFGTGMAGVEQRVRALGAAHGAEIVGSFDPAVAGCPEANFRDYIHFTTPCLKTVFAKIALQR